MIKTSVKLDGAWARCGKCGHKLGRVIAFGAGNLPPTLEIKCHSCKSINDWILRPPIK